MIVCRAASVWPPPKEVTTVICMRCAEGTPTLSAISVIWIARMVEGEPEWTAQLVCEKCASVAIPPVGRC